MHQALAIHGRRGVSGAVLAGWMLGCAWAELPRVEAAPLLWNVDFGAAGVSGKSGPAAFGLEADDFWNPYYFPFTSWSSLENLTRSDGVTTLVGVAVANANGGWGTGAADPMFNGYIYPNPGNSPAGGPILVTLTNLPGGIYDFYVYAHGGDPGEYSVCELTSAGVEQGRQATAAEPVYGLTEWIEGQQYVCYRDVLVVGGREVRLSVGPSPGDNAALNGLQIVLRQQGTDPLPDGCQPAPLGLVGWWKGDGSGRDQVGANDGVLSGGVTFEPGVVGTGFRFATAGDGVRLGKPDALRLQDFTIEAWIRRSSDSQASSDPGGGVILGYGYGGYCLGMFDDGRLFLTRVWIDNVTCEAAIFDMGEHHVAVTKSGAEVVFYLDGQAHPAPAYPAEFTFESEVTIGSLSDSLTQCFIGMIDELAVYGKALAATEIQAICSAGARGKCTESNPRGPLAWWRFDESEGRSAEDVTGVWPGTLSSSGAGFAADGVRGNALRLVRDEGGYVAMGSGLDLGQVFSLVAWVKTEPGDTTESMVLAGKHQAGSVNGTYLALNRSGFLGQPGKVLFVASDQPGQELVSTESVNDGQWHQVVEFMLGGVDLGGGAEGLFTGWMDEVRIYRRGLGEAEVEYLYLHPDAEEIPAVLAPEISLGLADQTVIRGAPFELSVTAVGEEPLVYLWSKDGVVLDSVEGSVLFGAEAGMTDAGLYRVVVSNRWGAAESSAALGVLWPPSITAQPVGQFVSLGSSLTLSVTAEGASPLSYQWFKDGELVAGATARLLVLGQVTAASAGVYQVRVENVDGVTVSEPARMDVYSGVMRIEGSAGGLVIEVTGLQAGGDYVLEQSTTLHGVPIVWEPVVTILDAAGSFQFSDPGPSVSGERYYRLRALP